MREACYDDIYHEWEQSGIFPSNFNDFEEEEAYIRALHRHRGSLNYDEFN